MKLSERIYNKYVVISLRILIGLIFIVSGFVKGVDPWGSVIKIDEYLMAWNLDIPHVLVVTAAFLLAGLEFVWGALLLFGCYKRVAVWLLSAMMAFMLPLTLYIAIASPVDDCGCFGDFLVLGNTATFLKNVVISAALVYLLMYNTRVDGLFVPEIQWVIGGWCTLYVIFVQLYGFNIQPMIDFRRFAPGEELLAVDEQDAPVYEFIYTKDGHKERFTVENIPDSTWTYVDRELVSGSEEVDDGFTVLDEDGDDIAPDIISTEGEQFLVTIPDLHEIDLSCSYLISDLNEYVSERGGSLIALVSADSTGIEWWRDISMATYPIYPADPKLLKEFARGHGSLSLIKDGRVVWKRTLASIPYSLVSDTKKGELIDKLDPQTYKMLEAVTIFFLGILLIIFFLDRSGKLIMLHLKKKKQ